MSGPKGRPTITTQEVAIQGKFHDAGLLQLLLGVVYAPKAAFDEILRRKLLLAGLVITAVAGLLHSAFTLYQFYAHHGGSLFYLAGANPVGYIGNALIASLAIYWVAKRLGGQGSYNDILVVLCWTTPLMMISSLSVGMSAVVSAILGVLGCWAMVLQIIGVRNAQKITPLRSIGAYLLGLSISGLVPWLAGWCLGRAIYPSQAFSIPSIAAGSLQTMTYSWFAAAALAVGAVAIPRLLDGETQPFRKSFAVLALAGVAVAAVATGFLVKVDPVGTFAEGIEAYESVESPDPDAALRSFDRLLQYYPSDHYLHLYAAHSASAAGDYELALKEYRKSETGYGSTPRHRPIAVLTGIAAVDYLKGDYAAARDELDGALSQWNSAEATGRLALVNLRLGKTKQAADLANSAIDLGDKSCIPQIVLAQAQTITNRPDDADEHISKVTEMNPGLAKRLADGPGDWSRAIERLTPMDLRMPLKMLQAKRVGWSSSTRQNSFI